MAVRVNASYKLTGWNSTQLKLRVPQILNKYDKVIFPQFQEEIKRVQFVWPNTTVRYGRLRKAKTIKRSLEIFAEQGFKAGVPVTSPRDIVDSGDFLRSQERIRGTKPTELRYRWNAPYAQYIYKGYTTNKGTVMLPRDWPPRDWIRPALEAVPLEQFFAREWRKLAASGL
jgi:hypothetical protein